MAKTPETLTAATRAATLGLVPTDGKTTAISKPATKADKHMTLARTSLSLGLSASPASGAAATLDPRLQPEDCLLVLSIDDIECYENNPRDRLNPRYEELKESIRTNGITNMLSVTRKPGALKYHPYGGGNTRLKIARELLEEGELQFSQLHVIGKKWRGHANVITAHLAENDLRGDISFWEKARAVAAVKRELQNEHPDRVLTAAEMHRELKSNGISFSIKSVQNFFYAIEHLSPIGPWLQAKAVNEALRPALAGVLALAERLRDIGPATAAANAVMVRYGEDLEAVEQHNDAVDPEDRKPAVLEVPRLIDDLYAAVAEALQLEPSTLPLMLSALEADSRISGDDLRNIKQPTPRPTTPVRVSPPVQRSLAGMLAPVRSEAEASAARAAPILSEHHAATAVQQAPESTPDTEEQRLALLARVLVALSDLVSLQDVLLQVPQMPFGFMVDIPAALGVVSGRHVPYPQLRAACWKLLVSVSYQLDPRWCSLLSATQSTWIATIARGPEVFGAEYARVFAGRCDDLGSPEMGLAELQMIFAQPEVSQQVTKLLQEMEHLRVQCPERFVPPVAVPAP